MDTRQKIMLTVGVILSLFIFFSIFQVSLRKPNTGIGEISGKRGEHSVDLPEEFVLINPTWLWTKVVDYICSCKIILSSSLHGLIISDAYKIPNIWLNEYSLNEGTFKFKDYFQSQNRELINIHSIFDYNKIEPYTNGNNICLDQLESSFIDMCIYMWNYK